MQDLDIDVIICTRDRPAELERCLRSVAAQTAAPGRVLICDSGSTPWIPPAGLSVSVVRSPAGLPHQRNVTIPGATAQLIAFLDDDVELSQTYLEQVVEWFHDHPQCVGTSGNVINDFRRAQLSKVYRAVFSLGNDDGRLLPSGDGVYLHHPHRPTQVDLLSGCNMVYRREIVLALRFDETLGGYGAMEDLDYSIRASELGELWMLPKARLVHRQSPTQRIKYADYARQMLLNGAYLFGKHRTAFGLSRTAYTRRLVGRTLAYMLLVVASRSYHQLPSVLSALPQIPEMIRRGESNAGD